MHKLYHLISALKNFLLISTGAIIAFKIVSQIYDFQFYMYIVLGIGGYILLSMFEEELLNDKSINRRKRVKFSK